MTKKLLVVLTLTVGLQASHAWGMNWVRRLWKKEETKETPAPVTTPAPQTQQQPNPFDKPHDDGEFKISLERSIMVITKSQQNQEQTPTSLQQPVAKEETPQPVVTSQLVVTTQPVPENPDNVVALIHSPQGVVTPVYTQDVQGGGTTVAKWFEPEVPCRGYVEFAKPVPQQQKQQEQQALISNPPFLGITFSKDPGLLEAKKETAPALPNENLKGVVETYKVESNQEISATKLVETAQPLNEKKEEQPDVKIPDFLFDTPVQKTEAPVEVYKPEGFVVYPSTLNYKQPTHKLSLIATPRELYNRNFPPVLGSKKKK
jgi:hypothetical protein